ncbi:MAG: TVP38/TMEM64 family protein [Deltaproteobacteria bacterium]|nr:TVP38/TMEM64 family protein [Deltaproteobacteria bacterium]
MKYLKTFFIAASVFILICLSFACLFCSLRQGSSWCAWWPHLTAAEIMEFMKSWDYWGVLASIGMMILHSFLPFPAEFVAIANGVIFGPVWGTVITWVGAMLGAFLAFLLARRLGQPFVRRVLSKRKTHTLERWVARHGLGTLFIGRFIPIISFNLINYAAGLTKISWWTFGWTTGVGILPMTVLMVVMGDLNAAGSMKRQHPPRDWQIERDVDQSGSPPHLVEKKQ